MCLSVPECAHRYERSRASVRSATSSGCSFAENMNLVRSAVSEVVQETYIWPSKYGKVMWECRFDLMLGTWNEYTAKLFHRDLTSFPVGSGTRQACAASNEMTRRRRHLFRVSAELYADGPERAWIAGVKRRNTYRYSSPIARINEIRRTALVPAPR